ncbi:sensor histidine kinase [Tistrella mobilis]|uniref:sensor histidine kinase n=1 Tax=Tistrella mobilis TaxID=171437 RepID=UPI0035566A87
MKKLKLYAALDHLGLRRSYVGKMLAISFVGVHVPLVCLVIYLMLAGDLPWAQAQPVLAVVLLATLAGTGATLWALHCLLDPVRLASHALHDYMRGGRVPSLPTGHVDEAGRLMADVQEAVTRLDAALDAVHAERGRLIDERQAHFEMLSRMSHELRTPLNAILGFAEVIQGEMMGPVGARAYSDYAGLIHSSGGDLLHMVDGLLKMSEAKAGPARGGPARDGLEPVDLHQLLGEVANLQLVHAGRREVVVTVVPRMAPGGAAPASGLVMEDPRALKQLLMFTLSGLIAGTERGREVRVELRQAPGGRPEVAVSAPGGFADADLPRSIAPAVTGGLPPEAAAADGFGHVSVQGFALAVAHAIAVAERIGMTIAPGNHGRRVALDFAPAA